MLRGWCSVLATPEPQYAANRHNIGFMTVDVLADRAGASFKAHKARADVAETRIADERCGPGQAPRLHERVRWPGRRADQVLQGARSTGWSSSMTSLTSSPVSSASSSAVATTATTG